MAENKGADLLSEAELEFSQAPAMVKTIGGPIFRKILEVLRWLVSDARQARAELVRLRELVQRGIDFENGGEDGSEA